eukprot:UN06743
MRELATSVDWQQLTLQEVVDPDSYQMLGRIPSLLEAEVIRDLVGTVTVGDQVQVTGIVKTRSADSRGTGKNLLIYLDVNAITFSTISRYNKFI